MEEARYEKLQIVWFHLHETPRRDESIDSEQISGFQGMHVGEGGVNGTDGYRIPFGEMMKFLN